MNRNHDPCIGSAYHLPFDLSEQVLIPNVSSQYHFQITFQNGLPVIRPPSPVSPAPDDTGKLCRGLWEEMKACKLDVSGSPAPEWPAFPSCLSFYNQQVLFLDSRPEVSFPTTLQKAWIPLRARLVCLPFWLYLIGSGFQYKEDIHEKKQLSILDHRDSFFPLLFSLLFMGFSSQECWNGVDHILSELSTMTGLSWVAPMAHGFIELDKAVVHVISLISFLWLCLFYLLSEG